MKITAIVLLSIIFCSCETKQEKSNIEANKLVTEARTKEIYDSILNETKKDLLFDTVGLCTSPVKVMSSRLVKGEYSNYKDMSITYKNVSSLRIEGIRFRWYGLNAFGEPADMGISSLVEGFGGGFTDDPLSPGKSRTSQWSILSRNAKKVVLAWPYEVVFSDGSKWELK